jgi:hypothetical protein
LTSGRTGARAKGGADGSNGTMRKRRATAPVASIARRGAQAVGIDAPSFAASARMEQYRAGKTYRHLGSLVISPSATTAIGLRNTVATK